MKSCLVKHCRTQRNVLSWQVYVKLMFSLHAEGKYLIKNLDDVLADSTPEHIRQKWLPKRRKSCSERSKSQLWRVHTVDDNILKLNLVHNVQVLTIKQPKGLCGSLQPSVLCSSQVNSFFNKNTAMSSQTSAST